LYISGTLAAIIFAIFGLYGISGAGYIRKFPYLCSGLLLIGSIYTIRGLWFHINDAPANRVYSKHRYNPTSRAGLVTGISICGVNVFSEYTWLMEKPQT